MACAASARGRLLSAIAGQGAAFAARTEAGTGKMYVEGVSTRKVARITEQLCGFEVSSTQVSRCTALLDEELHAWHERNLGVYPYVYLDARYEKARHAGQVIDAAVLVALGVAPDGKPDVLGIFSGVLRSASAWAARP